VIINSKKRQMEAKPSQVHSAVMLYSKEVGFCKVGFSFKLQQKCFSSLCVFLDLSLSFLFVPS
jgi:hypothetical protein